MKFIPHDYQQYAIDFVKDHTQSAILLDMGLGLRQDEHYVDGAGRSTIRQLRNQEGPGYRACQGSQVLLAG